MGKKKRHVLFWIKSSHGTDQKAIFEIPAHWSKKDMQSALEKWCSGFGAWTHGENIVEYGYKEITVLSGTELTKKYNDICKKKNKIIDQWKVLATMHNVRKLK